MTPSIDNKITPGPLVSVVIPLKNRRALVVETLASIQRQTCPRWEALVVDDGSTDGGAEQVAKISADDPRVRLLARQGPVAGAPACRNQGFRASVAPYVIFLDSDDLLAPTCLEGRVRVMEAEPPLALAVFVAEIVRDKPGDVGLYWNTFNDEDDLDRFLRNDAPWQTASPIWRRAALDRVGSWDETARRWQDWEFHTRAMVLRLPYRKVPLVDFYWRLGRDDSISRTRPSADDAATLARVLVRVRTAVDTAGLLTPERNRLFVGLFEYLMRPHLYAGGEPRCAAALWRLCHQSGITTRLRFLRGAWWLALRRAPFVRWKIERPLWASFSEVRLIGSQTHLRAKTPALPAGIAAQGEPT